MDLQININKLTVTIFVSLFTFSTIGACQEKQSKLTPQELLFQGVKEEDQKKGYELVQKAINQGAGLNNIENWYGLTALMHAAKEGKKEIVQLLLDANADIDIKNNFDSTALMWAATNGKKEIVQLLLNANANPDIQNKNNDTALILAVRNNHKEIVQILKDEPKRRRDIVQKEAGEYLPKVLAEMVSEYFVSCPKVSSDNKSEKPL